jgi:DNA-binding CsgD family transcriptional regulator
MRGIEGKITQEILDFIGGDPKTVASYPSEKMRLYSV